MRFRSGRLLLLASLPLWLGLAAAPAQAAEADTPSVEQQPQIDFEADTLDYDTELDVVTASGGVRMVRDGTLLQAESVSWDRKSGKVTAKGNVRVRTPDGDTAYGDSIELSDSLKDGVVENLLIVLADGGRLAARSGSRGNAVTELNYAAYSPCAVVDDKGCPKEPVWKITARKVTHDPARNRISYQGARLELFGLPVVALPGLSHPADNRGGTGLLVPDLRYTRNNGLEISAPYFMKIGPNRDLTVTPHIYTQVLPALELDYRALTGKGAYRVNSFMTYSSRIPTGSPSTSRERDFRGYFNAFGKFQLSPALSIKSAVRVVTDRTFLRRYDISRDDRLRSVIDVENVTKSSYFSLAGWGFQTLRPLESQGQVPIALPALDYRLRLKDPALGGMLEMQANTLAILRTNGQDTQRAFVGARWDLRKLTNIGQELQFTGYARTDLYHSDENALTSVSLYRGQSGWQSRFISAAAAEIRWPFAGPLAGGTQRLTPRLQIVASPGTSNLKLPNEDARSVDLEDSNLFALNRFPGYDRWEDGNRVTYGFDWGLDAPGVSILATVGQSYRLTSKPSLFPNGTGLTSRTSDIIGRATVKFKKLVSVTNRFRLDKDNLAIRRAEIDATIGTDQTYVTLGYLRLNRNVTTALEDLRDREEIRLGGRVHFAKYWSVFGSTIVDLTGKREDPLTTADGYEPVRHRLGLSYDDDCLSIGLTWKRDYDNSGDARRGNTYQIRVSLRNLGR